MTPAGNRSDWTIPNALSALRLAIALPMLVLAWHGQATGFLVLFGVALFTDSADGLVARAMREESRLGARIDTWGDLAMFVAAGVGGWRLWPAVIGHEMPVIALALAALAVSGIAGLIKHGRLPSYHAWSAKFSTAAIGIASLLLFVGVSPWPFRLAVAALAFSAAEATAITLALPEWRSDVRSLRHALRLKREAERP